MRYPLPPLLPEAFFARDTVTVARDLVGKELRRESVRLRITEVEAYCGEQDSACHARSGPTARNRAMFGPPGRAYVYLCYGIHHLLNLVTESEGLGTAVLIRSGEPIAGLDQIKERRGGGKDGPVLLSGPGKVGQALALDTFFCGHKLFSRGGLELRDGPAPSRVVAGPRVGIDYADPGDRNAPWRFADADSPWVTARKTLHLQKPIRRRSTGGDPTKP